MRGRERETMKERKRKRDNEREEERERMKEREKENERERETLPRSLKLQLNSIYLIFLRIAILHEGKLRDWKMFFKKLTAIFRPDMSILCEVDDTPHPVFSKLSIKVSL
jgi:hypothetical protein